MTSYTDSTEDQLGDQTTPSMWSTFSPIVKSKARIPARWTYLCVDSPKISHCEIELLLNGQVDILTVIAACYAISTNGSTHKYTLFKHNCFFFSWTILMVVSRYYLPYEIPHYESIVRRSQSQLERLTLFIVDETIQLFPKLVIDAVGIFRTRADKASRKGMNVLERVIWALPIGVIGFCYQKIFTVQLLLGLRRQLTESVKAQLLAKANAIYTAATSMRMLRDRVDACLWIDKTKDPVQNALKEEIEKIFWGSILEAISSGLGDINPEQFADPHRKFSLSDVWNAALHGGLLGAKAAVQELGDHISHSESFDRAWFAARGKALAAAQKVAERDCVRLNKPKRRDMWASNWRVWDECWTEIHKIAQPRAVEVAEKIVKELTATGTAIVIEGMEESENKTIRACVEKAGNESTRSYKPTTYANLQKHMQNVIKDSPLENTVFESMTCVWSKARQYLAVPVASHDTINEGELVPVGIAEADQPS